MKFKPVTQIFTLTLLCLITVNYASAQKRRSNTIVDANQTVVTSQAGSYTDREYGTLTAQRESIQCQIDLLSAQLQSSSKSKAKKLTKQLNALADEMSQLERRMEAYPESVRNPGTASAATAESIDQDREFERQLQAKAEELNRATDESQFLRSDDPEIAKAYRQYQNHGDDYDPSDNETPRILYHVQVGQGKRGQRTSFRGINNVSEIPQPNGTSCYYAGSYPTLSEAKRACSTIRSSTRYRDAFVVATDNGKRIPIPKNQNL